MFKKYKRVLLGAILVAAGVLSGHQVITAYGTHLLHSAELNGPDPVQGTCL